ncbi:hypothetical protein ANN_04932 [Periplaneta americana]|uniref:HAT C-terminal dimerisation domain-containing protein n=1 Tax=Periplaneta americana TaxID=6978 RepID=A0ABQ8T9R5_PERAM|nr:hypothetical protein ANN_04932 [Periplaneta americana]
MTSRCSRIGAKLLEGSMAVMATVTIPSTTSSVERSFSTLKRMKTFQRNSLGQERLASLAMMSIEKDLLLDMKVNPAFFNRVTEEFCKKTRRWTKYGLYDLAIEDEAAELEDEKGFSILREEVELVLKKIKNGITTELVKHLGRKKEGSQDACLRPLTGESVLSTTGSEFQPSAISLPGFIPQEHFQGRFDILEGLLEWILCSLVALAV